MIGSEITQAGFYRWTLESKKSDGRWDSGASISTIIMVYRHQSTGELIACWPRMVDGSFFSKPISEVGGHLEKVE